MPSTQAAPWRLFIALPLPVDAAAAIEQVLLPYAAAFPRARWLPRGALHVTLRFLGATPPDQLPALEQSVERLAAAGVPGVDARIAAITGPGAGRARGGDGVAWLTIASGASQIAGLAARLTDLLTALPVLLPVEVAARPSPGPHLTVARHADQPLIDALAAMALGPLRVGWQADRVVLYRSHPSRGAASYEPLHEASLAGPA